MSRALDAVAAEGLSMRRAALMYGVTKSTLGYHVSGGRVLSLEKFGVSLAYPCLEIYRKPTFDICDRIWENPPHGIFCEKLVCNIYHKIYLRRNHCPSLRPAARFDFQIQRFVFPRARTLETEKLLSKGVATYA